MADFSVSQAGRGSLDKVGMAVWYQERTFVSVSVFVFQPRHDRVGIFLGYGEVVQGEGNMETVG